MNLRILIIILSWFGVLLSQEHGRDTWQKPETIINKVTEAGYTIEKVYTFLPRDNIYICCPE